MFKKSLYVLGIFGLILSVYFYNDGLLAATGNPLESIKSHMEDTIKTIITIVQVLGMLALASFVGYSWWSGNFDKGRLIMILVGFIILAAAKPIIIFISSWIK